MNGTVNAEYMGTTFAVGPSRYLSGTIRRNVSGIGATAALASVYTVGGGETTITTTKVIATYDVLVITLHPNGSMDMYVGSWSGGWPAWSSLKQITRNYSNTIGGETAFYELDAMYINHYCGDSNTNGTSFYTVGDFRITSS